MEQKICQVQNLGLMPFQQAWDYQNALAEEIAHGQQPDTLLFVEHPHVFTFGRQGNQDHLLWSKEQLEEQGAEVLWIDRGGDITYHGPGQLVGYPLMQLVPLKGQAGCLPKSDYIGFIRNLETVLIDTLAEFSIQGTRLEGKTGVWVIEDMKEVRGKIASIGIKIDVNGVSRHGFALNVNPQMNYWTGIIPCGLPAVEMLSMEQLLTTRINLEMVTDVVINCFGKVFDKLMVLDVSFTRNEG
jgi:lipoyl(octanoyl) transferase